MSIFTKLKDLKDSYQSSLHYLALQPGHSGVPFQSFLLFFTDKDVWRLYSSFSEKSLRDSLRASLTFYYNHNKFICCKEFKMIACNSISLEKCIAPTVVMGQGLCRRGQRFYDQIFSRV